MDGMRDVRFSKGKEGARALAAFLAELTRQGINYQITDDSYNWFVAILGF